MHRAVKKKRESGESILSGNRKSDKKMFYMKRLIQHPDFRSRVYHIVSGCQHKNSPFREEAIRRIQNEL